VPTGVPMTHACARPSAPGRYPGPEHFSPLFQFDVNGIRRDGGRIPIAVDGIEAGAISMPAAAAGAPE